MTAYAEMPPSVVDQSGYVSIDSPCRKCGYNVRGLPWTGRCPECGTPVGVSIYGDLLRFSKPDYVYTLRRGINFIIGGIALMVLGFVLMIALMFGLGMSGGGPAMEAIIVFSLALIAGYICILAGTWLLTAPDPSGLGEAQYGTARRLIRICMLVGLGNMVLEQLPKVITISPEAFQLIQVISFLAGVMGLVGMFAQLAYLRKLAMRIPDPALSGRARFLMYAFGITYGVFLCLGLIAFLLARAAGPGGVAPIGCAAGIVGILMLVFGIMYLLMLEKLGRTFKQQALLAAELWGQMGAT